MAFNDKQSKQIDGHTYTVTMLPPRKAYKLALRIAKAVGPAIGVFADSGAGGKFAEAASQLLDRLNEALLDEVIEAMSSVTLMDDVPLSRNFDTHFHGELGSMMRWLLFALEVNYGNFITALGDALQAQGQEVAAVQAA